MQQQPVIGPPNNLSVALRVQYHTQFKQAKILLQMKIAVQSLSTSSRLSTLCLVFLRQQES